MNHIPTIRIPLLLAVFWMAGNAPAAVTVDGLRCEHLENPLGIDQTTPRLSWKMQSSGRNQRQSAYQILVSSSEQALATDKGDLWDSGKVTSDRSIHVEYAGKPLDSRMHCHWKVRVWDRDGTPSAWSQPSFWTMGLMNAGDFKAKWIGLDLKDASSDPKRPENRRLPARYLRHEFVADKKITRATANVCGVGLFDFFINGQKVGDHMMDPVMTEYDKRVCYVTFDVTRNLNHGANAIGVILGNGRYFAPRIKKPAKFKNYGAPVLFLQIDVEYEDGTIAHWISDESWRATANGPIVANNEYDGEEYDARKEMPGWNSTGFDDSQWQPALLLDAPKGKLVATMMEPNRVVEVIRPISVTEAKPGIWIVDYGHAFYGQTRIRVKGPAGTTIRMTGAYNLKADGTLKTEDNRNAKCTDSYTLKGGGEETWSPITKGQGLRRLQVTGWPGTPTADQFEGLVISTDMEDAGTFECSNPLINRIHQNIVWGARMFKRHGVPLDPDRDERQGWMGDPAKDSESDAFNFKVAPFYSKWLGDIRLDQREDGSIGDISPNYWDWGQHLLWPSVITIIPEWLHDFYGDRRAIAENYQTIRKWMLFHKDRLEPDFTVTKDEYGDWCDTSTMDQGGKAMGITPMPLLSTAYYYNNCLITARMAKILNIPEDERLFTELAAKVKDGFNKKFFDPNTGIYSGDTQCAYVLALKFGLVPSEKRDAVVARLVDDILVKNNGHLTVGLIGMQWLMQTLTDIGRPDVAYTIATQTTRPSWGYMISKGATSIWERWDSDTQPPKMNSDSLLILSGNLDAWFYQTLAGINYDPQTPGFKRIILKPQPVKDLSFAKASFDSIHGRIVSDWKKENGAFRWNFTIPANTTAMVFVPCKDAAAVTESGKPTTQAKDVKFLRAENGAAVYEVGSGTYDFKSTMKPNP